MKKVIVKSVIITISILIVSFFVTSLAITTFFPKTVSDMAFRVGEKEICVSYQEKAYLKSGKFADLATLTERCVWAGDDEKVIIYAEKFIYSNEYATFLSGKDEGYAYYIASALTISLYNEGFIKKAIETAFSESNGFSTVGPIHRLIATASENSDKQTLNLIKTDLLKYQGDEYATFLISVIDNELTKLN